VAGERGEKQQENNEKVGGGGSRRHPSTYALPAFLFFSPLFRPLPFYSTTDSTDKGIFFPSSSLFSFYFWFHPATPATIATAATKRLLSVSCCGGCRCLLFSK
jgi:hypothetical protein